MAQELVSPASFAQAVFIIAWQRHFWNNFFARQAVTIFLPLVFSFCDSATRSLNIPKFLDSKLCQTLSKTKIIPMKEYKIRSKKLRVYASTKNSIFKKHQGSAKHIIKTLDEVEIKSEKYLQFIVSSNLKRLMEESKRTKKAINPTGGFMLGVDEILKPKSIS